MMTHSPRRGFTLMELMVVLTIITIVTTIGLPSLSGISGGSEIKEAISALDGFLKLSKQTAVTQNLRMEVRFYKFVDPFIPGRPACYMGYQCWQLNDDGTSLPVTKLLRLPKSVLVESNPTFSTLLDPAENTVPETNNPLPLSNGQTATYTGFHFNRDGSTDLGISGKWFLTVHAAKIGDNRGSLPPNYATLRIDPVTGGTSIYRP